jgi:hypothetical protein
MHGINNYFILTLLTGRKGDLQDLHEELYADFGLRAWPACERTAQEQAPSLCPETLNIHKYINKMLN